MAKKSTSTEKKSAVIRIEGARQHNLKSLNLDIAHNTLTVITGPSGSGKSSLAFHTLYAEGQRRYVETFSPYIRQFFDRMDKPDVDLIDGILPAIAIEQKNHVRTTRSTVGTLTEINDYLKVLFGRAAKGYDPQTGEEIQPDSPESSLAWLFEHRNEQSMLVLFRVRVPEKATPEDFFPLLNQQGFLRVLLYGKMFRTDEPAECNYKSLPAEMWIVQDRIQIKARSRSRVLEALEAAARHGKGTFATVSADEPSGTMKEFTNDWVNPATGFKLCEPSAGLFSFNSPRGACVKCRGFGRVIGIDLAKAVPDPTLSIRGGAIKPFLGERGEECQRDLLRCCKTQGLNVNTPWEDLSVDEQDWVKYGEGGDPESNWREAQWYGIKGFFDWLESKAYKMHVRVFLSRYRSYTECPDCRGKRLRPEALCFRVEGKTLPEIWNTHVCDLAPWFAALPAHEPSLELVRKDIYSRLQYLNDVGLGYLTLDRQTRTLSGGEMERVNLTTCLGAALTNTLFVLDEPTVGLHARDIHRLVGVMKGLRDRGNTIVVVEHEEAVMKAADEIIDIGPLAGDGGGTLVYQGPAVNPKQYTGTIPWLDGRMSIPLPAQRRKPSKKQIVIHGATRHNLKKLDLTLPLGLFVCLSGVSGSGKSTLAHDVLFLNLAKKLGKEISDIGEPALIKSISGTEHVQEVLLVDQSSLARTPRSTPAVFCGAFDLIRQLMCETDQSKASSLQPGYFSFNSGEGRCDRCAGAGFERVEMQFLSDIQVTCPDCNGKRYRLSALEFSLEKKNISEILELSVTAAIKFLESIATKSTSSKKCISLATKTCDLLQPLARVGLGYLRLGQPLNTLSGGESQRLKLCQLLDPKAHQNKLLILDEPTTGLHFSDIATLLDVFQQLVKAGNSLLVIEHQLDVMAAADWLIDLGPAAGADGGRIVGAGTPEEIAATNSETALYLRSKLGLRCAATTSAPRATKPAILANEISLRGARHHNLKNISLNIPRDQFVVISGLSGSGKSTLAFDILFAEGQRRFLDSMSAYARQFADQLEKPEIDHLSGLPPTVAIEQRISQGGGKSTVATITEVWNFIRLLYAKLGTRYCCEKPVEKQSISSMEQSIRSALSKGPVKLFAPLIRGRKGYHNEVAEWALKHGYTMMLADKHLIPAENFQRLERFKEHDVDVMIIEFLSTKDPIAAKLEESLKVGKGSVRILTSEKKFHILSSSQSCATCGTSYEDLDPRHFSFNSPHGWCTDCRGYGLVPRKRHSLDLSRFDSLLAAEVDEERSLERMDSEDLVSCPTCEGARLHLHSRQVQVADVAIEAIAQRSIQDAAEHFSALKFTEKRQQMIARDIIPEIHQRLQFLSKVGLGYLQLSRSARTLSGGESQRIRLAAQLGSNLRGVLYVLDEPTIGLHPRDNAALIDTLVSLRDRGNSLVIVEHDEDTIARADWLIDLGPAAGRLGGQIVYEGKPPRLGKKHSAKSIEHSPTLRAMSMKIIHPSRGKRRPVDKKQAFLSLSGCSVNNLKNVSVTIPVGCLTVLTGVSGSGKSSLMHGCLAPAARKDKPNKKTATGYTKALNMELIDAVYEVDQSPIGKTSRSCPATYVGIFDEIRKVFAQLPEARARGFEATRFSFNTEGGRCEECKGNGRIKLEMDFLPSAWIPCETCQGKRYNSATLEVTYKGQSIADVLAMPIEEAARFFETHSRLAEPLRLLNETGLGYLTLGQASPTLSGGEAQRIKLISEIARGRSLRKRMANLKNAKGNLYLIEEPTVGLHLEDVRRLIDVLQRMVDEGHTVVVIEHHMAVAAEADWIIDVGPEAGADGGEIVAQGPPELVARSQTSRTAPFLAELLK